MRRLTLRLFASVLCSLCALVCAAAPCFAVVEGASEGNVAVVYTDQFGFGYSANAQRWSTTLLAGQPLKHRVGASLGLIATTQRLYAFNPGPGQWYSVAYSGTLEGCEIEGAVAIVWTDRACYAISSMWTQWARCDLLPDERVVDGGSCTSFALAWSAQRAMAYRANANAWVTQDLAAPPLGGVSADGLGLVYSTAEAVVFDPGTAAWIVQSLDGGFSGLSAAGFGHTALLWSNGRAVAYSAYQQQWFPLESEVFDGSAGGNVALVYNESWAHCFDAATGQWMPVYIKLEMTREPGLGKTVPSPESPFRVQPNPCPADAPLELQLPAETKDAEGRANAWDVMIIDAAGRCLHHVAASKNGSVAVWDWTDDTGRAVAPGVYWVRAESAERTEVRRIVRLK